VSRRVVVQTPVNRVFQIWFYEFDFCQKILPYLLVSLAIDNEFLTNYPV
jgi:hypothetical protein